MISLCAPAQNYWKARACSVISLFCISLYKLNIKRMMHDLKDSSDTFSGLENILNRHEKKKSKYINHWGVDMPLLVSQCHISDFYLLFTRTRKSLTFISKQTHLVMDINWIWLDIVTFGFRVGGGEENLFILNWSIIRFLKGWNIFIKWNKMKLSKVIMEAVLVLKSHAGRIQQQDRHVSRKKGSDLLAATGTLHLPQLFPSLSSNVGHASRVRGHWWYILSDLYVLNLAYGVTELEYKWTCRQIRWGEGVLLLPWATLKSRMPSSSKRQQTLKLLAKPNGGEIRSEWTIEEWTAPSPAEHWVS